MAGLLDSILGEATDTIEKLRSQTGGDSQRAEQAFGAAVGTILRGLQKQTAKADGAKNMWDLLKKHVDQGTIPAESSSRPGVQVRDLDPNTAEDLMKVIFGQDAPNVKSGYAKVVTLDPETAKKVFAQVLPAVLGGVFGAAERAPEESPHALPKILSDAHKEIDQRQPNASGIFAAILDQDHDGDVDLVDLAGLFARKPR